MQHHARHVGGGSVKIRVRVTSKQVRHVGPVEPLVDPKVVAAVLGAEILK